MQKSMAGIYEKLLYLHLILIFCKNCGTYICQRTKTVMYKHFLVYCTTIFCETHSLAQEHIALHTLVCSFVSFLFPSCVFLLPQTLHRLLFPLFFAPLAKCFPFNRDRSAGGRPGPESEVEGYTKTHIKKRLAKTVG